MTELGERRGAEIMSAMGGSQRVEMLGGDGKGVGEEENEVEGERELWL